MRDIHFDETIGPGAERPTRWNAQSHLQGLHNMIAALTSYEHVGLRIIDKSGTTHQYIRWEQVRDFYIRDGSVRVTYR